MTIDDRTLDRLRQIDPELVAERVLEPASERRKWGCPWCTSSDALHVNPKGEYEPDGRRCAAKCFSCGEAAGDTIALVELTVADGFLEACEWLADVGGIQLDTDAGGSTTTPTAPPPREQPPPSARADDPPDENTGGDIAPQKLTDRLLRRCPFETFRRLTDRFRRRLETSDRPPLLELAYTVLRDVWDRLELEPAAAEYLEGRGIRADCARALGTRSCSDDRWCELVAEYPAELLEWIGVNRRLRPPDPAPPPHTLWFPYFDRCGRLTTLRWRPLGAGESVKNFASGDAADVADDPLDAPHRPGTFYLGGAAARAVDDGWPVWLVEGELDALSIWAAGRVAVAAPGANWVKSRWWETLEDAPTVVVAGDGDGPGEKFTKDAKEGANESMGRVWAKTTCGRVQWEPDGDANDLRQDGALETELLRNERELELTRPAGR